MWVLCVTAWAHQLTGAWDCTIQVTRSLGDQDVKGDGLTATPEVYTRELSEEDEFLVLACDGLWDTLSNDTVVSIVQVSEQRPVLPSLPHTHTREREG